MTELLTRATGVSTDRIDGYVKVTGAATYAYEYPIANIAYVCPVQSTIAAGRIISIDTSSAAAVPGVLAVLTHHNAPRLQEVKPVPPRFIDVEVEALQTDEVTYRGQFVAAVVADSLEAAQEAAHLVEVKYEQYQHSVTLRADDDRLFQPARVFSGDPADTTTGDINRALASASVLIDATYTTPTQHHNPMEPHATIAIWSGDELTLYDSNQGPHAIRGALAIAFGLPIERIRVISPYIGGGFGAKVLPHPHLTLTAMAAQVAGRPVKLALTRQQMFAIAGYRTPTIQRVRVGADHSGTLTALAHDVVEQTSLRHEFAQHTAVASRMLYAVPNLATTHRLARLHVPYPTTMRGPGEAPGLFALESAIDELAAACGVDPVQLRIRNMPHADPASGLPFSSHGLVECLREGAHRFGWQHRAPRRDGRWLIGSGVAASTYPVMTWPATAVIRVDHTGEFHVSIGASDIGTGARTVLTQIAADALDQPIHRVHVHLGDTTLPFASPAAGATGTASWGSAIVAAARIMHARLTELDGVIPAEGVEVRGEIQGNPHDGHYSMHSFGAQFAEVRVDTDTAEVRVARLVGVFAVGRIINPKTARSQLVGGMIMGLSTALHEASILDTYYGDYLNDNLADYHIAVNADIQDIDVSWIDEHDLHINPMGVKGIGEVGIVGTAAAIANAVAHATGIRVRDLPILPDRLLAAER